MKHRRQPKLTRVELLNLLKVKEDTTIEENLRRLQGLIDQAIASGTTDEQSVIDALEHQVRFLRRIEAEVLTRAPEGFPKETPIGVALSSEDFMRIYHETYKPHR
jgi:hypothetical protein